jgi:hypothetical protein
MNKIQLTVTIIALIAITAMLVLSSCSSAKKITIPVDSKVSFEDTYTIIWNGYSKAYVYKKEQWLRAETFDYYFDVIQKRYGKEWKSVKSLHRIHPDYNGKAGKRDQTMYFGLLYGKASSGIKSVINSNLGSGTGTTDSEFRNAALEIELKDANMFMPYNKIRIKQKYDYENGKLTEVVELLKVKNGKETPFMKNEEEAYFYIKGKLNNAPTKFE